MRASPNRRLNIVSKYLAVPEWRHYGKLRLELRQIRDVPSAAERFDQQHAGVHTTPLDIDLVAFVGQRSGLSGNDLKIRIDTSFVPIREKLKGFPRREHCARLLLRFLFEDAQCREIILDLLKC